MFRILLFTLIVLSRIQVIIGVSHWSFDDCGDIEIIDPVGNRNGLVIEPAGSTFETTEGYLFSGIFVANGAFVDVTFPIISTPKYSFAMWIKPGLSINMQMLTAVFLQGTSLYPTNIILGIDEYGKFIFGRYILNTFDGVRSQSPFLAQSNVWTHIAGVYGAPTLPFLFQGCYHIYINGILRSSLNSFLPAPNLGSELNRIWIGIGPSQAFTGSIDEVWFWEYEIDAATITSLANEVSQSFACIGLPPPPSPNFTPVAALSPSPYPIVPSHTPIASFIELFPHHSASPSPTP